MDRRTNKSIKLHTIPAVSVTSTRAPLLATTPDVDAVDGVWVAAPAANSAEIYIGDSTVTTTNGFPLAAGQSVKIPVNDPSKIYVICTTTQNARAFYV